jgi:hypothetical protein
MYTLTRGAGSAAGEHGSLAVAMTGAGLPDPAAWLVTPGLPDQIRAGDTGCEDPAWVIRSPGVAHQLIDLLPDEECARRTWSSQDTRVSSAVMSALPASAVAFDAGARLAAHYAAAGELDWARIAAVMAALPASTSAFATPGPDGALPSIDEWRIGRIVAALAESGITVRPAVTALTLQVPVTGPDAPAALSAASSGPGKPVYRVWRAPAGYSGPGWGQMFGHYQSLHAAMKGAGYPSYDKWGTRTGMPDVLFAAGQGALDDGESSVSPWTIEGPRVALEFAGGRHALVRAALRWSPFDEVIISAVLSDTRNRSAWRLPFAAACDAGAGLAARYGTSRDGSLAAVDVFEVLSAAYADAHTPGAVPRDIVEDVAARLVRQLRDAGLNIIGADQPLRFPWPDGPGARVAVVDLKASGSRPGSWPTALLSGLADSWDRRARGVSPPTWIIPVPIGRLTPVPLVYLAGLCVAPLAIVIGCATGLSWPAGLWHRWVFWFAVAATVAVAGYRFGGIKLRPPTAGEEGEHGEPI